MMFVFALMGMEFFATEFMFDGNGDKVSTCPEIPPGQDGYRSSEISVDDGGYDPWHCVPRSHFDSFLWAMVTVFQVLSGENWNAAMYDGMRANSVLGVLYFVGLVVLGNLIILNLFL